MSAAPAPEPMVTVGDALAAAFDARFARKDSALIRARAFVADMQAPWDHEARELLQVIDQALGGSR